MATKTLQDHLRKKYSSFQGEHELFILEGLTENLVTDFEVPLLEKHFYEASGLIKILFQMKESEVYKKFYHTELDARGLIDPGNKAMMMSYDFHVSDGELKLIEVNTNASFLLLGYELHRSLGRALPISGMSEQEIQRTVENEFYLQAGARQPIRIAIMDQSPQKQKMFIEFILYRELFKKLGMNCEYLDSEGSEFEKELEKFNFVYNRDTDFYLERNELQCLKQKWKDKKICLSPHPYEYFLLADKMRFLDWCQKDFLSEMGLNQEDQKLVLKSLPQTRKLSSMNRDDFWRQRKVLFVKPAHSYGAKSAYLGSSLSQVKFKELHGAQTLVQDLVAPDTLAVRAQNGEELTMKYDLRFFVYQSRVQHIMARLYQGALTNLQTRGGGWATVQIQK